MDYKGLWVVFFPRCTAGPKLVGSCCIRLHTTANTHATTPNIVGATMLGVVAPVCTRPKTSNFLVTHYFHSGIVVCAYPIFWSCVHVRFYFSPPLIFTFLAASISHFLTAALNFHVFLARNSSPLFSITRFSSFSVIHVSVNIKNNAEKDTTLLMFFLSKSPGGHVISFQIKPWVALPVEWVILHWYACGAGGRRSVGVRSPVYQIFSDG